MKKKLAVLVFTMFAVFSFNTVSMADTITVYDGPGSVGAGLFYAQTGVYGSFGTFCLETNEYIALGSTYTYTIDAYAIAGGTGGSYEIESGIYGDPISYETAYLFTMFNVGKYGTSDFEMSALQVAFWLLEEEDISGISISDAILARAYELIAEAEAANWTTTGGVYALNLYDGDTLKQSLLVLVPEPMTLILLGFGLVGLGFTRRYKK